MICCAARSAFGRRAEPERSEGGWSEAQRSGAKWRGRGLGQRNNKIKFYNKNSPQITNCAQEKFKTDIIFHQTEDRH